MPAIIHVVHEILFEWDSRKAVANYSKHGVSFAVACEAFFDPFLYVVDEEEYVGNELREKVIGLTSDWWLLWIVYAMKEDRVSLISARKATTGERVLYETR